ncbi:S41 family peptidase [Chryseobacterium gleum]|uniref:S41 family peptidase n=1 Tax=Chryseobacterium gleum TaxID=250 RepID=UPI00241D806E|nr:S41 family peptidase [Chryseobacterium gleum]
MKKFLLNLLFIILSSNLYTQDYKVLTRQQMYQDIDSLTHYLKETHINPFYRYPEYKYDKDVVKIKKSLATHLNSIDFYLKIETLLAKLEDGHTDLPIPIDLYKTTNPYELPYLFNLKSNRPYIINGRAYDGFTQEIPLNSEILSINGIPAKRIVRDIISLNTGETADFRAEYGAYNFSFFLENLYKTKGNYAIKYKSGHLIKTINIKGHKTSEIAEKTQKYNNTNPEKSPENDKNFELKIIDNVAVIDFRSFDWNGFQKFTDSAFTEIKNKKINHLVLNMMDNGGGDSDVGDELFQYILDKPYKQYDKVIEKNSQLLKNRLKDHLQNRTKTPADLKILNTKNGTIDTVYYSLLPIKENPLRYTGNIYLLINTRTFSSAADFAQCFKYYKRGLIIGQTSGGLIKSFGDIVTTHLPNSNLELTISSKLYYNIGAKENTWMGVTPDINADNKDIALSIVSDLIKKSGK